MTMFLGTHGSRVGVKGRISIPSSSRTTLREQTRHCARELARRKPALMQEASA